MGDQDKTLLKRTTEHEREDLAAFLEDLAGQIREGEVTLEPDGDRDKVVAALPERVHLSLECKDSPKPDGLKHELELEIWWIEAG